MVLVFSKKIISRRGLFPRLILKKSGRNAVNSLAINITDSAFKELREIYMIKKLSGGHTFNLENFLENSDESYLLNRKDKKEYLFIWYSIGSYEEVEKLINVIIEKLDVYDYCIIENHSTDDNAYYFEQYGRLFELALLSTELKYDYNEHLAKKINTLPVLQ